ncbi:hypothetical protein C1G87_1071 [Dehalococcoides mccartyi]|uniref:Uncharacterized protein n=1 Tax=Dehalococcoides mccartyi TaxID=61435 RepID=A0A328ENS5_9CHLR|nr:hypothetical protein C1G87_1071 [Dehalococcoides mccartyi]
MLISLFFLPAMAWLYDYARTGAAWGLSILLFSSARIFWYHLSAA